MLHSQPPETRLLFRVEVFQCCFFFQCFIFPSDSWKNKYLSKQQHSIISCGWCILAFLFVCFLWMEESLIKCFGDRSLSCTLRKDQMCLSEEFLHFSFRAVHWTNPLNVLLNRMFLRNTLNAKIHSREILLTFRMNLSVLFPSLFSPFYSNNFTFPSLFHPHYCVTSRVSDSLGLHSLTSWAGLSHAEEKCHSEVI